MSDWCIKSVPDGYTVCKVMTRDGWRYEPWKGRACLVGGQGFATADEAKKLCNNP